MIERKVAALILYDKKKKVLLQHRSVDALRYPGFWGFFGGGIEEGETPEDAVKRELIEELEYKVKNPKLILVDEHISLDDGVSQKAWVFAEEYDENQPLILHEGQGYGWFTISEALEKKVTIHRREQLQKIQEFLDSI